jgi:hypothetical protein
MIIITSGAFISSEFQVELGKIPPAFVPLGNKRLYEHQVANLKHEFPYIDIYLSVTDAYEMRESDRLLLNRLGVQVINVPDGLSLAESILYVINSVGRYDETLRILHGDTLLSQLPKYEDVVAVAYAEDEYTWEVESASDAIDKVWCGYFAFSDIKLLARSLTAARGKFAEAVRQYQKTRPQQTPLVDDWHDLGHVNTYFRTRARVTTQRSFNDLRIQDGVVSKTSEQRIKMEAESNWFSSLPSVLKKYVPQLIDAREVENGKLLYQLEYLPHLPLNELYVHANLQPAFWNKIFKLSVRLLQGFSTALILEENQKKVIKSDFEKLVNQKSRVRLEQFSTSHNFSMNTPVEINGRHLPELEEILNHCVGAALALPAMPGVSHGDLCFSNVLYDSRSDNLKVLDPRGLNVDQEKTILGDLKYDFAKFAHSVLGLYDHIVAGLFTLKHEAPLKFIFEIHVDQKTREVQALFEDRFVLNGLKVQDVYPLVVLLFLSMLPLHEDKPERQLAFLANALRLYAEWTKENS